MAQGLGTVARRPGGARVGWWGERGEVKEGEEQVMRYVAILKGTTKEGTGLPTAGPDGVLGEWL